MKIVAFTVNLSIVNRVFQNQPTLKKCENTNEAVRKCGLMTDTRGGPEGINDPAALEHII